MSHLLSHCAPAAFSLRSMSLRWQQTVVCLARHHAAIHPLLLPCAGALLATLTEVSVSAAVAAEAGQWRWAWSTDGVRAKLLRMRRDLKRAFAAAGPATPAIHSVEVRSSRQRVNSVLISSEVMHSSSSVLEK